MRKFLEFFIDPASLTPEKFYRPLSTAVEVVISFEKDARKLACKADSQRANIDYRKAKGTQIDEIWIKRAKAYADQKAELYMSEGFNLIRAFNQKQFEVFALKLTGLLEYSIGVFTLGQVLFL